MDSLIPSDNGFSIEETEQEFLALPDYKAVSLLLAFVKQMNEELNVISAHQDKTTTTVLGIYKKQLEQLNALTEDQSLPAEDRKQYIEWSMQILAYVNDIKTKDDTRKDDEKKIKMQLIGGMMITVSLVALAKASKYIGNAILKAKT